MALTLSPSATSSLPLNPSEPCSVSAGEHVIDPETSKKDLIQQFKTLQKAKRLNRKRRHSISEDATTQRVKGMLVKHRRQNSGLNKKGYAGDIILPTKFLLGGNIRDPLNLNSMLDEKVNLAANAVTPSSSPLPPRSSKIHIVIPSDMTDPLGLNHSQDVDEVSDGNNGDMNKLLQGHDGIKQYARKKKRRRKSQHEKVWRSESKEDLIDEESPEKVTSADSCNQKENVKISAKVVKGKKANLKFDTDNPKQLSSSEKLHGSLSIAVPQLPSIVGDPIVSPVIPQDIHRNSNLFSPKSRKRKSLSQTSAKLPFPFVPDLSTSTKISSVEIGAKTNSNNDKPNTDNAISEEVSQRLKVARLQSQLANKEVSRKVDTPADEVNETKALQIKFKPSNAKFQYGNYSKYYGYRNPQKFQDVRLGCLKKEWFKDKDVLDVGCNVGHFTILIARDFSPRKVVGVDIDGDLINSARKNVRHYATSETRTPTSKTSKYPDSMAIMYGPIVGPPLETGKDDLAKFPNNVVFLKGNYVPEKAEILQCQEPEYDVIMCMSVSKWVHLNWGDEGLVRTFQRFYKQLRPGGKLILEPQEWKSYGKKKKLTETIYKNYTSIKLRPAMFPRYLVEDIGFEKVEYLELPHSHQVKGFQRPIQLYSKPE